MKTYALTGGQLRTIVKDAYYAGINAMESQATDIEIQERLLLVIQRAKELITK
jgi:hypothetical protein